MGLDLEALRKACSLAWHDLRKIKFWKATVDGPLTTIHLFGGKFKYHFDASRKMAWQENPNHRSNCFKLCTCHKDWVGPFSYPRSFVYEKVKEYMEKSGNSLEPWRKKGLIPNHDNGGEYDGMAGAPVAKKVGIEVKKVCCSVYRADKKKLTGIFGGVLWTHLDREIGCLCMKAFGLGASSLDYTLVWNNLEAVKECMEKAPALLPLWRDQALIRLAQQADIQNNDYDYLDRPGFTPDQLDYPTKCTNFVFGDIIKNMKELLQSRNSHKTRGKSSLTPAGWKYLLKLKPLMVNRIRRHASDFGEVINFLAEIGEIPRYTVIKRMLGDIQHQKRTENLRAVVRAAFRATAKSKQVRKFYDEQFQLVWDWFRRSNEDGDGDSQHREVILDSNQRKAPWEWFMRQQADWHERIQVEQAERRKKEAGKYSWSSLVPETSFHGYMVVPLVNGMDLYQEGKDLHHCVAAYARNCQDEICRVFSIRKLDGEKVATLEIRPRTTNNFGLDPNYLDYSWVVNQVRGHCNGAVEDEVKVVAEEVAKAYGVAMKQLKQEEYDRSRKGLEEGMKWADNEMHHASQLRQQEEADDFVEQLLEV